MYLSPKYLMTVIHLMSCPNSSRCSPLSSINSCSGGLLHVTQSFSALKLMEPLCICRTIRVVRGSSAVSNAMRPLLHLAKSALLPH